MELIQPSILYKESFIEAVKELRANHDTRSHSGYGSRLSIEYLQEDFADFVRKELAHAYGEYLAPGFVPQSDLWLVDHGAYIGHLSIRHRLNEYLQKVGGHIGYTIRPSERRYGYGYEILRLGLVKAKELGLVRVLLTCDADNIGSRKIIEKNGGVFENQMPNPDGGPDKLRFWIDVP